MSETFASELQPVAEREDSLGALEPARDQKQRNLIEISYHVSPLLDTLSSVF